MRIALAVAALVLGAACSVGTGASLAPATPRGASTPITNASTVSPPSTRSPGANVPPAVSLSAGAEQVDGWLGSYCWMTTCVDVARIPDTTGLPRLDVDAGTELTFEVEAGGVVSWVASRLADRDADATELGRGGEDVDPDTGQTASAVLLGGTFNAPPAGDWLVTLAVRYPHGGDAFFAWHVAVE